MYQGRSRPRNLPARKQALDAHEIFDEALAEAEAEGWVEDF